MTTEPLSLDDATLSDIDAVFFTTDADAHTDDAAFEDSDLRPEGALPAAVYRHALTYVPGPEADTYEAVRDALWAYQSQIDPTCIHGLCGTKIYNDKRRAFLAPLGWTLENFEARFSFQMVCDHKAARDH